MDCILPGSFVQGISQARILGWVAISYSRETSQPRYRSIKQVRQILYIWGVLFNDESLDMKSEGAEAEKLLGFELEWMDSWFVMEIESIGGIISWKGKRGWVQFWVMWVRGTVLYPHNLDLRVIVDQTAVRWRLNITWECSRRWIGARASH